jgi:deoxycytidine triphosphate deaminase
LPICPESDRNVKCGVLTSDEIEYCVNAFKLLDPFDKKLLRRPARYMLTLGEDYAIGGELLKLRDEHGSNELKIPPFQVAIVSTKETLNLPRFLIARWNLDIELVYRGLLWVGGPQVDPGYYGKLFCPLYNLSDKTVKLTLGQDIAPIDFTTTTPFIKGKTIEYPRPPKRRDLRDYGWFLQSALFTDVKERIDRSESEIEKATDRINRTVASIFTVLAILVAAISLIMTKQTWKPIPPWGWCALLLSIAAFILAIASSRILSSIKKWLKDP